MEIIYNIDLTFLGHKSFDSLSRVVDRKNVRVLGYQKHLCKSVIISI